MNTLKKGIDVLVADSQSGTAIVMAMIILLVLSVIGIYAVTTSTVETQITGVEQGFQVALYAADAGEPIGTFVTKAILHFDPQTQSDLASALTPIAPSFPTGIVQSNLITSKKLFINPDATTQRPEPIPGGTANIDSTGNSTNLGLPANSQLLININRLSTKSMPGASVEFASGYEGEGQGGGGGNQILYSVDSVGQYGFWGAKSRVDVGYIYVPGVAGGE